MRPSHCSRTRLRSDSMSSSWSSRARRFSSLTRRIDCNTSACLRSTSARISAKLDSAAWKEIEKAHIYKHTTLIKVFSFTYFSIGEFEHSDMLLVTIEFRLNQPLLLVCWIHTTKQSAESQSSHRRVIENSTPNLRLVKAICHETSNDHCGTRGWLHETMDFS